MITLRIAWACPGDVPFKFLYLKEISINSDKSYFDTNTKTHHHFFDNSTKELTDISDDQVEKVKINTSLPGKKITSVEVLVRVENN
jgi:Fur family iron response transcriptional regulator